MGGPGSGRKKGSGGKMGRQRVMMNRSKKKTLSVDDQIKKANAKKLGEMYKRMKSEGLSRKDSTRNIYKG